jgi:hypothetical protein
MKGRADSTRAISSSGVGADFRGHRFAWETSWGICGGDAVIGPGTRFERSEDPSKACDMGLTVSGPIKMEAEPI